VGNALAARLFYSLRRNKVPVFFETGLAELIMENGAVVGAVVQGPSGRRTIRARRGVVLATGGIAHNRELRARLFPEAARPHSLAPEGNTGDGARIAEQVGAVVDEGHDSAALWMPTSILKHPDGSTSRWPHIILDRAKPGLLAVNKAGKRFVNEANSYHDFVMGMLESNKTVPTVPAYLICDASFMKDYGVGLVFPGARALRQMVKAGYAIEAKTLDELAQKIGVDATGLAFGRGSTVVNRFNGDASNKPNPCLRPVGPGPFYAVAVWPADLASSGGLRGDTNGHVLNEEGRPIPGLYACGNDMTSIFRGTYPGPGTTLGPAIVFGWRIARFLAAHEPVQ
jgi:succinate dehydrogenase/fumarate reductase flavoprotein subunit